MGEQITVVDDGDRGEMGNADQGRGARDGAAAGDLYAAIKFTIIALCKIYRSADPYLDG